MDIGNALRRAGRDEITIRSVIANTIGEMYPHLPQIQSVQLKGKSIIIKTGNPLVNSELQLMRSEIELSSKEKLKKIGIHISHDTGYKFV